MRAAALPILIAFGLALAPAPASAVTVEEVVSLSKAGISEAVILALIDRDRTVFSIEPDELVALKRDGLSDKLVMAMLKSGRAEGDEAARADSAATAAAILTNVAPTPEVIVVGHGPERPNTLHPDGIFGAYPAYGPFVPPYGAPYASHRYQLCFAQSTASPVAGGPSLSYVTVCPPVMQRGLGRR
jgi:hypothetical protein